MGMKWFGCALSFALVASAYAGDVDFDFSARMFKEDHFVHFEYEEHNYYDAFPRFVNETKRENLNGDFIETTYANQGFTSYIHATGRWNYNSASDSEFWNTGRGSIVGVVTVNTPGEYFIDASTLHLANAGRENGTQSLFAPDGSEVFVHTSNGEFHERRFLTAGSYLYRAGYSTSFTFTNSFWDFPWVEQNIRLSVQAVPEPGSMLALAAGLACLAKRRR